MKKLILFVAAFGVLSIAACRKEALQEERPGAVRVRMSVDGMVSGYPDETESALRNLYGFRFADGVLAEVFPDLDPDGDGVSEIHLKRREGRMVFWANASGIVARAGFEVGSTTLDSFMDIMATAEEMSADGLVMTGETDLEGTGGTLDVRLARSVARIGLQSEITGVQVRKIVIGNISPEGYVNAVSGRNVSGATAEFVTDFGGIPFGDGETVLFYPCEQPDVRHEVRAEVLVNGAWRILRTEIGGIRRNTAYTIKVYGNGALMGISVGEGDWDSGEGSSSDQLVRGLVDVERSELSSGVRVSEGRDTVFVPYYGSDFRLVLAADAGSSVTVRGSVDGLRLENIPMREMVPVAGYDISSVHRYPGSVKGYVYLDIVSDGAGIGRVVIVSEPNPVMISGNIVLDADGRCDFGRYVEGELGTVIVPSGKTVSLRFPEGESRWARLDTVASDRYVVQGGWKPNDPHADGREQGLEIVVADIDGGHEESYPVTRLNWGLPVVEMNGVWWCKYNLRGNVKRFEDQITIQGDPAAEVSLSDYLTSCTDSEYMAVAGGQYQAGKTDALELYNNGEKWSYDGYDTSNKGNFGTLDPTAMAPDGYRIPDYNHFRFFGWGNNSNLGHGSNQFNNQLGQRLYYRIVERNIVLDGVSYGPVNFVDFTYEGSNFIMMGLGHQYNSSDIASMNVLFATYGNSGSTWGLEGYPESSGRGNWFKYAVHNAQKTRTIRCVKIPVEYIYE